MNNYIQIYNNVVSNDYCDELREKFDSFPFNQDVEQGPMSFTQINFNSHPEWNEDVKKLSYFFTKSIEQYKKDCAISDEMWPVLMHLKNFV